MANLASNRLSQWQLPHPELVEGYFYHTFLRGYFFNTATTSNINKLQNENREQETWNRLAKDLTINDLENIQIR